MSNYASNLALRQSKIRRAAGLSELAVDPKVSGEKYNEEARANIAYIELIRPVYQYERIRNRALIRLSEGPDYLIVYLSELRFINPRSDTSEF